MLNLIHGGWDSFIFLQHLAVQWAALPQWLRFFLRVKIRHCVKKTSPNSWLLRWDIWHLQQNNSNVIYCLPAKQHLLQLNGDDYVTGFIDSQPRLQWTFSGKHPTVRATQGKRHLQSMMQGGSESQSQHIITASIWLWTVCRYMFRLTGGNWGGECEKKKKKCVPSLSFGSSTFQFSVNTGCVKANLLCGNRVEFVCERGLSWVCH